MHISRIQVANVITYTKPICDVKMSPWTTRRESQKKKHKFIGFAVSITNWEQQQRIKISFMKNQVEIKIGECLLPLSPASTVFPSPI